MELPSIVLPDLDHTDKMAFHQALDSMGPYMLQRSLGSGGMAKVYLGVHRETGVEVAIKVLKPELLSRKNSLPRFQAEFRTAHKLNHPRVVRALDYGTDRGLVYLVLEYVDGESLAQILRSRPSLPEAEATKLIIQVAEGLEAAHNVQLIHRDIKPANIMLTKAGDAKITDLGLVKDLQSDCSLTQSGTNIGTLLYMAPELYENGKRADIRSDLYSLGVTYYQMLTGRLPFVGGQIGVLHKKMKNQFAAPREAVPGLSPTADQAACQLLQFRAEKRPASCREFIELLTKASIPDIGIPPTIAPSAAPTPVEYSVFDPCRRSEERHPTSIPAGCLPLLNSRNEEVKAEILDISATGAHLQVLRRFEIGSLIDLFVGGDDGFRNVLKIRWVRSGDDGKWRVGGRFHRKFNPSELEQILKREVDTAIVAEH